MAVNTVPYNNFPGLPKELDTLQAEINELTPASLDSLVDRVTAIETWIESVAPTS